MCEMSDPKIRLPFCFFISKILKPQYFLLRSFDCGIMWPRRVFTDIYPCDTIRQLCFSGNSVLGPPHINHPDMVSITNAFKVLSSYHMCLMQLIWLVVRLEWISDHIAQPLRVNTESCWVTWRVGWICNRGSSQTVSPQLFLWPGLKT